jgi:hypothetical protein
MGLWFFYNHKGHGGNGGGGVNKKKLNCFKF